MIILNNGLSEFLHSLMPVQLQKSLHGGSGTYIRARALSAILLAMSAMGVVICLIAGILNYFIDTDVLTYEIVLLAITALMLVQTILFYKFSNYWASGLGFTIFYFLVATVMVLLSGGYDSPGRVFLLTSPMIAFLISGWQEGVQNAVLTILFGLGLAIFKAINFDLPNIFYAENQQVMFVFNWVITVIVILFSFVIYEAGVEYTHRAKDDYVNDSRGRMIKFDSGLNTLFHKLIPESVRYHLDIKSRLYARVRIMAIMLWVATLLSGLSMLILVLTHLIFQPEHLKFDIIIIGITILFSLQTWLFYKYKNYWLSGALLGYFYFLLALSLVIASGGYDSPTIMLLMISPIVFFVVGGVREGVQNAVFVGIAGLLFGYLKLRGFDFFNIFYDVSPLMVFAIMWTITIVGITLCLVAYDTELERTI